MLYNRNIIWNLINVFEVRNQFRYTCIHFNVPALSVYFGMITTSLTLLRRRPSSYKRHVKTQVYITYEPKIKIKSTITAVLSSILVKKKKIQWKLHIFEISVHITIKIFEKQT
jgi:hypothetical protein